MTNTPNIELLERVMTHINDHPEQHNQNVWLDPGAQLDADPDCGTAACFAGWATLLEGWVPALITYAGDEPNWSPERSGDLVVRGEHKNVVYHRDERGAIRRLRDHKDRGPGTVVGVDGSSKVGQLLRTTKQDDEVRPVSELAMELLGLDRSEANNLFHPRNDREALNLLIKDIANGDKPDRLKYIP